MDPTPLPQYPELVGDIAVNELFGPTYQGEGLDVGRPCYFVRLHHCPVRCPGCDTSYTWSGEEKGTRMGVSQVVDYVLAGLRDNPGCGVVLSGGEPLIHYRSGPAHDMVATLSEFTWVSLETSGFVSPRALSDRDARSLHQFLHAFSGVVHVSPKVTPCLHGEGWTDAELLCNVRTIMDAFTGVRRPPHQLAFKFVARDKADVDAIVECDQRLRISTSHHPLMVMPYGVEPHEVIENSLGLLPHLAKLGYVLTPRLHTLLWGKKRGV